jgi:tRNA 5-methylaminomethyl-2-thiouridine biosynthesis bifunctional protein
MTGPIVPAELAFAADGTPYSPRYGDVYHSADGGPAQARHVFLAGNDLPARWAGTERFVILETGFGVGLNFLATLQEWRRQPHGRTRRLHYVAVEKHPFAADDLARLHAAWPEFGRVSAQLLAQWPLPLPGLHRLDFGDAMLTLAFGDAAELLPELSLKANALYLDGFAPDRNPDLWSEGIIRSARRLLAPGATVATWTVAGDVRRRLASADFLLERRPGFAGKREMLVGRLPGRDCLNIPSRRRIAVIGAGIAGASVADALARRGHAVTVLESAAEAAAGASGNLAGVFRPLPSADDGRLARVLRAGFMLGRRRYATLPDVRLGWTGVLHLARDERHAASQRAIAAEQGLPAAYCRFVERDEASSLARWPLPIGGWWFPEGGWINPPSLCRALLKDIPCRFGAAVHGIERSNDTWQLRTGDSVLEADALVLANGVGATGLVPDLHLPIRPGRGTVTHLPQVPGRDLALVLTRLGYVTPALDGIHCAGATLSIDDLDPRPRLSDHAENLFRLEMIAPGFGSGTATDALPGRVGLRPMSPDRLPLLGALSKSDELWLANGFGARGLVFSAICGELLAAQFDDEPLPLEQNLAIALSPSRRTSRRRKSRASEV